MGPKSQVLGPTYVNKSSLGGKIPTFESWEAIKT